MGKGKVSKDRTAKCSQKQTGSQDNDTFTQNENTQKKQKNKQKKTAKNTKKNKKHKKNRPMTQGLHLAHRVIFLYYCRMFQSINSQPCQGT